MRRLIGGMVAACSFTLLGTASAQPVPPAAPAPTAAAAAEGSSAPSANFPVAEQGQAECFPTCRSGYTCHAGQCVSLCNPPCGAGERCTAQGECEVVPAAPAAALPVAPAVAPPSLAPTSLDTASASAPSEASVMKSPGALVFAARVGVLVHGWGTSTTESEDSLRPANSSTDVAVTDHSYVMLSVDGLVHVTRGARLGLSYSLIPYAAQKGDEGATDTKHFGHEHSLSAIVEGLISLRPEFALSLRALGGLRMLVPGGDLSDRYDAFMSTCQNFSVVHCEAAKGPFLGPTGGVMAGFVGGAQVRWRIDLLLEHFSYKFEDRLARDSDGNTSTSNSSLAGSRLWLLGGIEL